MRPSSTFFKDGCKRLLKNKVATVSLIIIIVIALSSILIPMFWPYGYETQLGITPGKPVDPSFKNLAPFEYGRSEIARMDAGEKVFPHVFGTDSAGRDLMARTMFGARVSIIIGIAAALIGEYMKKEYLTAALFGTEEDSDAIYQIT